MGELVRLAGACQTACVLRFFYGLSTPGVHGEFSAWKARDYTVDITLGYTHTILRMLILQVISNCI